jgi:integrase
MTISRGRWLIGAGLLRLPATILKERYPRRVSISFELRVVLEELKQEQQRVPNFTARVFTRRSGLPIKDINKALNLAP